LAAGGSASWQSKYASITDKMLSKELRDLEMNRLVKKKGQLLMRLPVMVEIFDDALW